LQAAVKTNNRGSGSSLAGGSHPLQRSSNELAILSALSGAAHRQ